ncbi:MAG: DUF3892 domain-containing protein [Terracidiphilus sp.]|nr:DUF3892 domain-containing protein [Terracidiphilus sp.]
MAIYEVTCAEKHARYERVASIGCLDIATHISTRLSEDEAISRIKHKTDSFFIEKPAGHRVWLIVAEREGQEYLKSETDGEKPNNLLERPACPWQSTPEPSSRRTIVAARSHGTELPCMGYWWA